MKRTWSAGIAALMTALPLAALQEGAEKKPEPPKESRTAYIRRVYEKDRASYGDACRAVLSLAKGEHTDAPHSQNHGELVSRGIVVESWELEESSKLTKGTLAYMLCKALGIKGGLTMRIAGINRRYALREAIYVGLMPKATLGEYVAGRELLDTITNAEIYKQEGSLDSIRK